MIEQIKQDIQAQNAEQILRYIDKQFGSRAVFSTSFGIEDQVITHLLAQMEAKTHIFTLDTGRLFQETYSVWNRTILKYPLSIQAYFPKTESLENLLAAKGPNSFYDSVENRKECCFIRKIEPLQRAIQGYSVWITGIRADQSANRDHMQQVEFDQVNQIIKIHPLFHWTLKEVEDFIHQHNIPYNKLHNQGFPSIGCQPCTRAIQPGEDFRAGRWWWEDQSKKECGLHRTTIQ